MSEQIRPDGILVKVSGDEIPNGYLLAWLMKLSRRESVTVCVGGGTQINEEFEKRGWPRKEHGPLGREAESLDQQEVARDVLLKNKRELEDRLAALGVRTINVEIPVFYIGGRMCHVNADLFVLIAYHGHRRLFVVTKPDRAAKKRAEFAKYPKVHIVSFPPCPFIVGSNKAA